VNDETDCILICNAGSSSLKTEIYERRAGRAPVPLAHASVENIGTAEAVLRTEHSERALGGDLLHDAAAAMLFAVLLDDTARHARVVALGHRVVHGGAHFSTPVRIDEHVRAELEALAELAPLHNPPALAVIRAAQRRFVGVPHVAVFDTAFFAGLPEHARRYAVPADWRGVQRYGFHGLAHESLCRGLVAACGGGTPARAITLQLGNGCSAAALAAGRPVDTSMGFTPLEGLIMATRAGDLDAGVVLHKLRAGMQHAELEHALQRESGLRALSGVSGDMRELLVLEAQGHAGAAAAIAAFCYRVRKYVGAYAAALGGLDALAFGGGIGENAPEIRARICRELAWLGLELDEPANAATHAGAARISTARSTVAAYVVNVDEAALIAAAADTLLQ
jgi:acetate kinase